MQRRKFIKNILKGLSVLLMKTSWFVSPCYGKELFAAAPNGKTIIVIGAGISGLAAAQKLQAEGFNIIVLEAQDRIGGRLRSNRSLGEAFDEGASWIHGIDGNPVTSLAQQAGMKTFYTDDDSLKSYDLGGVPRSQAVYDAAEEAFYDVLDTLMNSGSPHQSFEEVFKSLYPAEFNDRLWRFFLSTYLTFDCGDLDKLSSTLYDEGEEFEGEERIATNGYDTIPQFLAEGLIIQLNQRVTHIDYSDQTVQVTHNGTISQADYVLVTVPLGVLKANTIQFVPALPPEKQAAIQKVGMNCVNKFLLTWENAFWDDVQYIVYTPETKDKFNYFVNVKKIHPTVNALMTFAYADYGRKTESMSDAEVIDEIMGHLKEVYGDDIPNPSNLLRTQWYTNENSFGAYSYTAVETEMKHFEELAEAIDDKVFFAGEHTHEDYYSTVHGAYLSGLREAEKIIKLHAEDTMATTSVASALLESVDGRLIATVPSAKVINYVSPLTVSFKLLVDLPNITLVQGSLVTTGVAESANPAIVNLGTMPYELRIPWLTFGDRQYLVNLQSTDLNTFSITVLEPR